MHPTMVVCAFSRPTDPTQMLYVPTPHSFGGQIQFHFQHFVKDEPTSYWDVFSCSRIKMTRSRQIHMRTRASSIRIIRVGVFDLLQVLLSQILHLYHSNFLVHVPALPQWRDGDSGPLVYRHNTCFHPAVSSHSRDNQEGRISITCLTSIFFKLIADFFF